MVSKGKRPDLMTITMPEKIRFMLDDLKDKEQTSKSKVIHRLVVRQYNLCLDNDITAASQIIESFESDILMLAATRKITGELYTKIRPKIEEIREVLRTG